MAEDATDIYARAADASTVIRVSGAPSTPGIETGDVDEIDANAHETFTLEELRRLILAYRQKSKDFLLARVTTPDPDDQGLFFNFYYSAPEINRILFRFESSRRLLHRMKVKNPLNNMYIVGQVFYYKLTASDIDRAIVEYFFSVKRASKNVRNALSAIFTRPENSSEDAARHSKDCLDIKGDMRCPDGSAPTPADIISGVARGSIPRPATPPGDRRIEYAARYFASDDDFLLKADVRDYFRKNALEAEDDFLYEIDRTRNDFMALLDEDSNEAGEEVGDWRRIFSAHVSLALSMLFVCLLLGGGPGLAIIFLPLAVIIFLSFLGSLFYILFCRRASFDTMAVNSLDGEEM